MLFSPTIRTIGCIEYHTNIQWSLLSTLSSRNRRERGRRSWRPGDTSQTPEEWIPQWLVVEWCSHSWGDTRWCWCTLLNLAFKIISSTTRILTIHSVGFCHKNKFIITRELFVADNKRHSSFGVIEPLSEGRLLPLHIEVRKLHPIQADREVNVGEVPDHLDRQEGLSGRPLRGGGSLKLIESKMVFFPDLT